ncbi:MAG: cation-translocating P-type ATPase [Thermofilaceae archaeon]|nr:cation-translocating P-type ATPase [Thermofilaceae archaeon]
MSWHTLRVDETLEKLKTSREGLSKAEAEKRLREYGPNELAEKRVNPLLMFLGQFRNYLVYILFAATALSLYLGEVLDAVLILAILVLMAFAGFLQEYKAERAIEKLKEMTSPKAKVMRDGVEQLVDTRLLVPGDIVLLEEGDRVPADMRLMTVEDLEVDESPLTGESVPVEKDPEATLPQDTQVYERVNMVFMGTYVVKGKGTGVVVATGMNTELGKIAASLEEVKAERTLFEVELDRFGKWIGTVLLALSVLVFLLAVVKGSELVEAILLAASLAVAAVPEGLPAIATAILAVGALRMAARNAIVRKLAAIETLGACNVICSDKTGTITKGEMRVRRVFVNLTDTSVEDGLSLQGDLLSPGTTRLLWMCDIYNDAELKEVDGRIVIKGQPTEVAVKELALKAGVRGSEKYPKLRTLHFDRVRKRKSTLHQLQSGEVFVATFGAPELLLDRCSSIELNGRSEPLTPELRRRVFEAIENYASKGFRTLGAAYKVGSKELLEADVDDVERDLTFLAVLAISDPPREGVRDAVETAVRAGIRTIMVTGDHELTAAAIAKEVGLDSGRVVNGAQVDKMSDEELEKLIGEVSIFARVTPKHKLRIVNALKGKGFVVAMTGDGVNDAPAIKAADVGIAMGIRGTDVSKEVSDLVLADDNYVTIVEAVKQGRIIYENIRKPIDYLISCNMGEVFAIMLSEIMGFPTPLTPAQILWINLVTDSLPAFALGLEPEEPGIMDRQPRGKGERLISLKRVAAYVGIGLLTASLLNLIMYLYMPYGVPVARTAAFAFFTLGEIFRALAFRSERRSFLRVGTTNKILNVSLLTGSMLSLAPIYLPQLASAFELNPLAAWRLLELLPFIILPLLLIEAGKYIFLRRK